MGESTIWPNGPRSAGWVQLLQFGFDDGLDLGVADEGHQPGVREGPLPVGPQRLLEWLEPVEIVDVLDRRGLSLGLIVGQAGQEYLVVRRLPGEVLGRVQPKGDAASWRRHDRTLHRVEPAVVGQQSRVLQHRRNVTVDQQESTHRPRRPDELESRFGDDTHLTEAGAHRVEQVGVAGRRAVDRLSLAGHDLQFDHVVALYAVRRGRAADAADDKGAADGEIEVLGEHGRGSAVRQRRLEYVAPRRSGPDDDPVVRHRRDVPQRGHVRDDATLGLCAAEGRVAPAVCGERTAALRGPLDRLGQVVRGRRHQDGLRQVVHEVPEVFSALSARLVIEAEFTIELWWRNRCLHRDASLNVRGFFSPWRQSWLRPARRCRRGGLPGPGAGSRYRTPALVAVAVGGSSQAIRGLGVRNAQVHGPPGVDRFLDRADGLRDQYAVVDARTEFAAVDESRREVLNHPHGRADL